MTPRRLLTAAYIDDSQGEFNCPHCGAFQVATRKSYSLTAFVIQAMQCHLCKDVRIQYAFSGANARFVTVYPGENPWPGKQFTYGPEEVLKSYGDARHLYTVHTGAAGAYARRALELLLDNAGYVSKTLDGAIKLAKNEEDLDRRLPKRLLQKLDYIREIGNFALHTRRDDELVIVEIDNDEVATCLEAVEALIEFIYEDPVADYLKTVELNAKLAASGKRPIELPQLPPGITAESLVTA